MVSFADVAVTDATAHRMLVRLLRRARRQRSRPLRARTARPSPTRVSSSRPPGCSSWPTTTTDEAGCGGIRELRVPLDRSRTRRSPSCATRSSTSGWRRRTAAGARPRDPRRSSSIAPAGSGRPRSCSTRTRVWRRPAALYRSHGYESIQPYNDNPNATDWFRKQLGVGAGRPAPGPQTGCSSGSPVRSSTGRWPRSLCTTRTGGFADRTRMIVSPQLAWLSPSQRQSGASKTCRTNHPITKLCVISRSCRSPQRRRAGTR